MTFKTAEQYEFFRLVAVDAMRGNEVIAKELLTHNLIPDFNFYVDLYTALVKPQGDFSQENTRAVIDAALRMGFMMGRSYGVTVPENTREAVPPRRSRRPSHKKAQKQPAKKDGKANEE